MAETAETAMKSGRNSCASGADDRLKQRLLTDPAAVLSGARSRSAWHFD
jgi:hypothetical protein